VDAEIFGVGGVGVVDADEMYIGDWAVESGEDEVDTELELVLRGVE
jgi:hypothetical protein